MACVKSISRKYQLLAAGSRFPAGPDSTHAQGNPLCNFGAGTRCLFAWLTKTIRKLLAVKNLVARDQVLVAEMRGVQ